MILVPAFIMGVIVNAIVAYACRERPLLSGLLAGAIVIAAAALRSAVDAMGAP